MANKKSLDEQYKETAEQVKSQLMQQLPILRQNLKSLKDSKQYFILPIVIHNICVIFEREAYQFLTPAIQLWEEALNCTEEKDKKEEYQKTLDKLKELKSQEDTLYQEQYLQLDEQCRIAEKNGESINREIEIGFFNHLEADLSIFYRTFVGDMIRRVFAPSHKTESVLEEVTNHCISVLEREIPKKEEALKNVDKFLGL